MGFIMSKIIADGTDLYLEDRTMYAVADAGAFDAELAPGSDDLQKLVDEDESVMVVIDQPGVESCLKVLDEGGIPADTKMLAKIIREKFMDGFIIKR